MFSQEQGVQGLLATDSQPLGEGELQAARKQTEQKGPWVRNLIWSSRPVIPGKFQAHLSVSVKMQDLNADPG